MTLKHWLENKWLRPHRAGQKEVTGLLSIVDRDIKDAGAIAHDPPLAENAFRIVKGKTTGVEILQWFGVPDLQANGSEITLFPESTMGQYRAKLRESLIKAKESLQKYEDRGHMADMPRASNIDPDYLEKTARMQPYSSIDDEHTALLYLEYDTRTKGGVTVLPAMVAGGTNTMVRTNKLLVFINKKTNIVDEFSFWEEFEID